MASSPLIPAEPDHATPRLSVWRRLRARPGLAAFGWRALVAVLFVAGLSRLPVAVPPAPGGPAQRLWLTGVPHAPGPIADPGPAALPPPMALLTLAPQVARASNAAVPVQRFAEVALPFRAIMADDARQRATDCLAAAQWYEAGDNPPGERAVAQVVLNRVRHPAFAKSVCGVVFQDAGRANACQFTFACDGSMNARQPGGLAWARARAIATAALNGAVDPAVGLATHYHADYVVPKWRDSLIKLAVVGPHLFYRWPGAWGTPPAMRALPAGSDEPLIPQLARLSPAHHMPAPIAVVMRDLPEDMAVTAPRPTPHLTSDTANPGTASADRITQDLDPAAFPGGYAVQAYALCKGHAHCLVLGHARDGSLGFVYLQDTRKGVQTALWNCARTPRGDTAQCLPDGAAVTRLIAGW